MQWEYGCLVRAWVYDPTTKTSNWTYTFHGPRGSASIEGDSSVEVLNRLGQSGWEAFAVEPRYRLNGLEGTGNAAGIWCYTESLDERITWFKRPINTGTSR